MSSSTPIQTADPKANLQARLEASLSLKSDLPVDTHVDEFMAKFRQNQALVVSSATGSGKSTRIPQYVLQEQLDSGLKIAVTQPRRLAARALAPHVASQLGEDVGGTVGYQVRFDGNVDKESTRIVFLTDGYLLAQASSDPLFRQYSTIIIDEAHERSTNTDILFVLLKRAMKLRQDLKVIIMSASLNASKFRSYFNSGLLHIEGTRFPVRVYCTQKDILNYKDSVIETLMHIRKNMPQGDILVFLPGEKDIRDIQDEQAQYDPDGKTVITALYSALSKEEQQPALDTYKDRTKIVLATNVAETSITIRDLVYVIDTGLVKSVVFNPRTGMKEMDKTVISQASAIQRAGRVGRTKAGHVFRLYTWETFNDRLPSSTVPAIRNANLVEPMLSLFKVLPGNPFEIDFVDPPTPEALMFAIRTLNDLNLISVKEGKVSLTEDGDNARHIPLHPVWYNTIKEARELGCLDPILTIAAIAGADGSIYERQHANAQSAVEAAKGLFRIGDSDHLTELNMVHSYMEASANLSRGDLRIWCLKHFLSPRRLQEIVQIRKDLATRVPRQTKPYMYISDPDYWITIAKTLARGLATQTAWFFKDDQDDQYKTVHGNQAVLLAPGSCLIGLNKKWVVYSTASAINDPQIHQVTAINPEWVIDLPYFAPSRIPKNVGMDKYRMDDMARELEKYRKV